MVLYADFAHSLLLQGRFGATADPNHDGQPEWFLKFSSGFSGKQRKYLTVDGPWDV
jgi:hypothetical protein